MANAPLLETRLLSSLSKVFADEDLKDPAYDRGTALKGEVYSFQLAYRSPDRVQNISVEVESDLGKNVSVRCVGLAPSEFPCYANHDENVLRCSPGLYPDPLWPLDDKDGATALPRQWRALWVTVRVPEDCPAGPHPVRLVLRWKGSAAEATFLLEVMDAVLPAQTLIHTNWFHSDCIATHYGVKVFSAKHWKLIEKFAESAVAHGVNMILTPLFTPPLDTQVGGERPTVQLVGVAKNGQAYSFDFSLLERWVKMCRKRGIRHFEFSHLATQWGAAHCPKIVADVGGREEKFFGWEDSSTGKAYRGFLDQFLPRLAAEIKRLGIEQCSWFHVSDEPGLAHLETYKQVAAMLKDRLPGFPFIDALSNYEFYQTGAVENPIPASNHIQPFLDHKVPNLWTYYCCSQYRKVANRFFCMPSARNRILGWQLFKFDIRGFLHWGFNFYYSQYSRKAIDPFRVTDALNAFPSGDPFIVYPGPDGPIESLRGRVFYEGLQDMRALQMLASVAGRERAVGLLDEGVAGGITFDAYPVEKEWLLARREAVNRIIQESAGQG